MKTLTVGAILIARAPPSTVLKRARAKFRQLVLRVLPIIISVYSLLAGPAEGQSRAATPTLISLVSFDGIIGRNPEAGVTADADGNLLGTTLFGGIGDAASGTVYEIAKTTTGYASMPTCLVDFSVPGYIYGRLPRAGLIIDSNGNLLGTNQWGGTYGYGTVFEIAKTADGYASTPTVLVSFGSNGLDISNGAFPVAGLIADGNGNLFGTTERGGANNGTVFEIPKTAGGYANTPTVLVSFNLTNGENPAGRLLIDANGNLFGTASEGGSLSCDAGCGTVFEIAKTASGYASTPTVLVSFDGTNGAYSGSGLIADAKGNLFGTTGGGGGSLSCESGCGTVFEIAKTASGYASTPTVLVSFDGTNGAGPGGELIADADGNLFGTTFYGGAYGYGTVFEIAKTADGYGSTPTILISFDGTNGRGPEAGLIADAQGNLFGTTFYGGAYGYGMVFEITGSGFVPPPRFAGTPGSADCFGRSVAGLVQQYGGLNAAAVTLRFSSVGALQDAVLAFCGG